MSLHPCRFLRVDLLNVAPKFSKQKEETVGPELSDFLFYAAGANYPMSAFCVAGRGESYFEGIECSDYTLKGLKFAALERDAPPLSDFESKQRRLVNKFDHFDCSDWYWIGETRSSFLVLLSKSTNEVFTIHTHECEELPTLENVVLNDLRQSIYVCLENEDWLDLLSVDEFETLWGPVQDPSLAVYLREKCKRSSGDPILAKGIQCYVGTERMLELLEIHDLNQVTSNGDQLIHVATKYDRVDVVRALLERGADPTVQNASGLTPLTIALNRCLRMAALLIDAGCKLEEDDHRKYLDRLLSIDLNYLTKGNSISMYLVRPDDSCRARKSKTAGSK